MSDTADYFLQRVAKWRMLFAGWQLGTRAKSDPEAAAVRDHREVTILLRVEASALARILIEKGICTAEEFTQIVGEEAALLDKAYEKRFPGISSSIDGLIFGPEAAYTMRGWKP